MKNSHRTFSFIATPNGLTIEQNSGKTLKTRRSVFIGITTLKRMVAELEALGPSQEIAYNWEGFRKV